MCNRFVISSLRFVVLLLLYQLSHGLTGNERQIFLGEHNKYRKMLMQGLVPGQPRAAPMQMLTWDDELARKAQLLANKCQVGHDSLEERQTKAFYWVGQNWAGARSISGAVRIWFDEHKDYSYRSNTCKAGKTCGHYTQIAWATTQKLGCGYQKCTGRNFPFGGSVVCNYGPGSVI
ncbi:Venom allergen [Fasciolopsis buskii]|uniref:Venom allergen n=1 Tax=Fasciolopsis buskii TaxID=27845 RepID=A0A8E0S2F3_9TREM|nr:Venom allergen [Fasciolopsis buski]